MLKLAIKIIYKYTLPDLYNRSPMFVLYNSWISYCILPKSYTFHSIISYLESLKSVSNYLFWFESYSLSKGCTWKIKITPIEITWQFFLPLNSIAVKINSKNRPHFNARIFVNRVIILFSPSVIIFCTIMMILQKKLYSNVAFVMFKTVMKIVLFSIKREVIWICHI